MKQLARLQGETLIERAVRTLSESDVDEVVVVLGAAAADIRKKLDDKGVKIVVNPDFRAGLSSSLKIGVRSLDSRRKAVIVCLADQPFVTRELIDSIVARFREHGTDAVAASSEGVVSPPVLLSGRLFGEIDRLRGDKGAKSVLLGQANFDRVEVDPSMLIDIDTQEELSKARRLRSAAKKARTQGAGGPSRGRPSSGK